MMSESSVSEAIIALAYKSEVEAGIYDSGTDCISDEYE